MAREIVTSENKTEHDAKKLGLGVDKKIGTNEERPLMESKLGPTKASYTLHHPDKYIDIGSVRTPEKERGKGHASKMMQYLHEKADEMGYDTKLLASPLDKKTKLDQLVNFYKKHGYELTGQKGNMAGEPEMIRKHKKKDKK
jgi:predicted GNAT family acetyltransferase